MSEQLRREIAEILQRETRDPRIGVVTITDARVTPDLQQAKIFVSVAGDADERAATLEGLAAATPFVRSALAGRLDLRRVPELVFLVDSSLDYAMHIERLLHEVLPHGEPAAGPSPADADPESDDAAADDPDDAAAEAPDGAAAGERGAAASDPDGGDSDAGTDRNADA